ncbi:MAG: hypothetical protein MSH08_07035 [Ezakiella sp.]|nr:hypothetical protein [Ezakiella sp.]MDD7472082.1 hypothetical protein [Bacillota bacterium]MDY3924045.1 hypothetical protein [Ezakiella sp.]
MKKKNIIFIYIFLFTAVVNMSVNYVILNDYNGIKYGMDRNEFIFQRNKSENSSNGLDFLLKYNDLMVIAETNNKEILGVYDPTYFYFIYSTKFISYNKRYFSMNDYKNKTKTSIFIYPIEVILKHGYGGVNIKYNEKKYDADIINIFDPYSTIAENNSDVKIVKNLFCLNNSEIDKIYLSGYHNHDKQKLKEAFLKNGFEPIKTKSKSILKTFSELGDARDYVKFFFISFVSVCALFLLMFNIYIHNYYENLNVYASVGAKRKAIFMKKAILLFFQCVFISLITCLINSIYLKSFNKFSLNLEYVLQIEFVITVAILISILINFIFAYNKVKRKMRW